MYGILDQQQDIVSGVSQEVTSATWTTGSGVMTAFYTSSTQSGSSGQYFLSVYDIAPTIAGALTQFSVAYGNYYGSGSVQTSVYSGVTGNTPSKATYSQYRNYLLAESDETFTIDGDTNEIMVIAVNRNRYKESIDLGNWQLNFSGSAADTIYSFVDVTAGATSSIAANQSEGGENYYIVSGSITNGVYDNSGSNIKLGLLYPKQGLLILDAAKLRNTYGVTIGTGSGVECGNHWYLINAMQKAGTAGYGFQMRSSQQVRSEYYFVRAKNSEWNYSNNPSYYTTVNGIKTIRHSDFVSNPVTYINQVGLYNDDNQLLAVAKISKPIKKDKTRELTVRIKLDF